MSYVSLRYLLYINKMKKTFFTSSYHLYCTYILSAMLISNSSSYIFSSVEVWNLNFIFWDDDPYKYLIKPIWIVILSLLSIIMGFYSSIPKKIGLYLNSKFLYIREFSGKDSTISTFVILVIIILGTLSLIYRINAGIYGYGISDELLAQYAHLEQIFRLIGGLQLLLILYLSYKRHSSLKKQYLIQNYILWPLTIFISFRAYYLAQGSNNFSIYLCGYRILFC